MVNLVKNLSFKYIKILLSKMTKIKTPVLLIAFNRPDTASQVLNQIRKVQPSKLYMAVDGPRGAQDSGVFDTRKLVETIDWDCEVHTLFREENLGCGRGPAEAINWAFINEESLMILEDDCVPALSFFSFCENMLDKYRNDMRIGIISGRSHQHGCRFFDNSDYLFTHYAHTCGWATWKNRWEKNDFLMSDFNEFIQDGGGRNIIPDQYQAGCINKSLHRVFNDIENISKHAWDYQWSYTRLKNGWLDIVPCHNLIQNIGIGDNATHSKVASATLVMPYEEMPAEIRHPRFVMVNRGYEELHFNNHIHPKIPIYKRALRVIKYLFKPQKIIKRIFKT